MKKFLKFIVLYPVVVFAIFIVLLIDSEILDLGSILLGDHYFRDKRFQRYDDPFKKCFSKQRTIMGAVESYNIDKDDYKDQMKALDQDELVRGGYLKKNLNHEVNKSCVYRDNGDLTGYGIVYCEYHGQSDPLGKIKPSKEYYRDERRKEMKVYLRFSVLFIIAGAITWFLL